MTKKINNSLTFTINRFIDKIHFRSYNHIIDKVVEAFPDVDLKDIKQIIDNRLKDHFMTRRKIAPYYVHIFSPVLNTWFHDLFDNGKGNEPRYWHVFIGTNNHYAVVYPLNDKRATSIHETLTQFINTYHPYKLTSDEESGFIAKPNIKLCNDNDVLVHIITEQNHSALGLIDRFMRTLRDMNTPNEKTMKQSHDVKYQTISPKRMYKLIEIYNNTYHSRIKCSPLSMFNDTELEQRYIEQQLKQKHKQEDIKDFHLHEDSFVRYVLSKKPKNDMKGKKRYQLSRECYKITTIKGNIYTLIARDGTVMNLPRYRLVLCAKDGSKPNNCKWADTIPGAWNGVIKNIISYDSKTNKYTVAFEVPDKADYIDEIPKSYMLRNYPQMVDTYEHDLMKQS